MSVWATVRQALGPRTEPASDRGSKLTRRRLPSARDHPLFGLPAIAPLRVGVVGAGTGGLAAALLLARAGHDVEVFERVDDLAPVGAGILLQPTGMRALERMGLLEPVLAAGARIERLHGTNHRGRPVLDLHYSELRSDLFGLGLHRGSLFSTLCEAVRAQGVAVHAGTAIAAVESGEEAVILTTDGARHGPYDLVVGADGARSTVRAHIRPEARVDRYAWGALWTIAEDPAGEWGGVLRQFYRGTEVMLGFLPVGGGRVSVFWSVRGDRVEAWRGEGPAAWKDDVRALTDRAEPLLAQIDAPADMLFSAYHDVRLRRYHAPNAVLLGDAAHATSPQLGQGANLALMDAWELAALVGDGRRLDRALARYSRARRPNLRFYGIASRWLTPFFQSSRSRLAWPRDRLTRSASRMWWYRRQMLLTLIGAKTGVVGRLPEERYTLEGLPQPDAR